MSDEEKKDYNKDKKAYASLTMSLPGYVLQCFKKCKTAHELWDALEKWFEGNDQLKRSKKELLRKQFDVFTQTNTESFNDMIVRYSQLMRKLSDLDVELDQAQINRKLLDALPAKWEVRVMMLKDKEDMETWSLEDLIGKLQAYELEMQTKETGKSSALDQSFSSGIPAFFSGNTSNSDSSMSTPCFAVPVLLLQL